MKTVAPFGINSKNVGRIAERIVSNELEYNGFRVSDLNKEGTSVNADLLAAKGGKTWQIQVKGATEDNGWWFGYGHCNEAAIGKAEDMFNKHPTFYQAKVVVLVSVKTPSSYDCLVLPTAVAEKAAQLNLDYNYRIAKKDGSPKKPGPVWVELDWTPKFLDASKLPLLEAERQLLTPFRNNWNIETTCAIS